MKYSPCLFYFLFCGTRIYIAGDTDINKVKDGLKDDKETEVRIRVLQ